MRTAPLGARDIRFVFSGDEAGQGWGINPVWGGYRIYEAMRAVNPDFFIHPGDQIYADGPLKEEVKLDDGTVWKNVVTPAKSKVAETLDDFRGCFAYNLIDDNKRRFASEVPFLVQWDDHETHNNWYPGESLAGDDPLQAGDQRRSLLAANARRAMFEYNTYPAQRAGGRAGLSPLPLWSAARGLHARRAQLSRRPTAPTASPASTPDAAFLGPKQLLWLKQGLLASKATWKVIASDMPIGIQVPDAQPWIPKGNFEAWANGDNGMPLGRELELASLFAFLKNNAIRNVVWITADVHYGQAIRYDPAKGAFGDFDPFWEFVSGPINAGTFGPNDMDQSFGPEIKFTAIPAGMKQNQPPSAGFQFFGQADIDAASGVLTVALKDATGKTLFSQPLTPAS